MEPLFYDAARPERSSLLGNTVGAMDLGVRGEFLIHRPMMNATCLVLPVLVIGGNFLWLCHVATGVK